LGKQLLKGYILYNVLDTNIPQPNSTISIIVIGVYIILYKLFTFFLLAKNGINSFFHELLYPIYQPYNTSHIGEVIKIGLSLCTRRSYGMEMTFRPNAEFGE
jgi:hypothetical protein